MYRVVVACVGLLALAGGSVAEAQPAPYYQPGPAYNPIYTWTGFYVGINGGGGWGSSQWDAVNSFDVSGGLIGGTVGYNWQFGQVVVGAEGDIDWSGIKGDDHGAVPRRMRDAQQMARHRPRAAGLCLRPLSALLHRWSRAWRHQRHPPVLPGGSITNVGWTVGAGLEVGLVSNVSVKAEYLFVDLGNFNCGLNCALAPSGNVSFTTSVFRAGANVRF